MRLLSRHHLKDELIAPPPRKSDVSIRNITPRVRCELTHYNSGIHKEVASGLRKNYHIAFDAHQAKMSNLVLGAPLHKTSARQGHNVFCCTCSESIWSRYFLVHVLHYIWNNLGFSIFILLYCYCCRFNITQDQ